MTSLTASDYLEFTDQLQNYDTSRILISGKDVLGTQVYVRAPFLDIAAAIQVPQGTPEISRYNVYADTLSYIPLNNPLLVLPAGGAIKFFARDLFRSATPDKPIRVKCKGMGVISLYSAYPGATGSQVPFAIETISGVKNVNTNFARGGVGCAFVVDQAGNVTVRSDLKPPNSEYNVPTIQDRVTQDGTLAAIGFGQPDYLGRLLRYQMLLATAWQNTRLDVSVEIARWIILVTAGVGRAVETRLQASTFLASISISGPSETTNTSASYRFVPSLDLSASRIVLESRLGSALAFENAYQTFAAQQDSSANIRTIANVTLEASEDTQKVYEFMGALTQKRYDEAAAALGVAKKNFQDIRDELEIRKKALEEGIEKYKKEQIAKAVFNGLVAIVGVVAAVAACVVAPPAGAAGAAAAAGGVAKVAEGGAEVAEQVSNIAKMVNKIKDLVEKMGPILESLSKVLEAVQSTMNLLKQIDSLDDVSDSVASDFNMPVDADVDVINLGLQWDEFNLDVTDMLSSVVELGIDGASEYKITVQKMVLRAKATLACQSALTQAGDDNVKAIVQTVAAQRQTARLRKAIANLQGNPVLFNIYREAMLERLLAARTWVYLDFQSYLAAYMYYSMDSTPPIVLSPVKPIPDYTNDGAALQAAVVQTEMKIRAQRRRFRWSSDRPGVLPSDWKSMLAEEKSMTFAIDPASPTFNGFNRVRVCGVRCYVDGVQGAGNGSLALQISYDGHLQDKNISPSGANIYFVCQGTSYYFEYMTDTKEIVMDGAFARPDALLKPTPFTVWTVNAMDTSLAFDGATKCTFELDCEVSVA